MAPPFNSSKGFHRLRGLSLKKAARRQLDMGLQWGLKCSYLEGFGENMMDRPIWHRSREDLALKVDERRRGFFKEEGCSKDGEFEEGNVDMQNQSANSLVITLDEEMENEMI